MDEEVAAITSNSPLSTSKELSAEEHKEDSAQRNGEANGGTEDLLDQAKKDELKKEAEKEDTEDDDEEEEEGLEGGLESNINEDQLCRICDEKYKQPRILSCLHVFCTPCLEKQLEDGDTGGDHDSIAEGAGIPKDTLKCTLCKQMTVLTSKGSGRPASGHGDGQHTWHGCDERSTDCVH